MLFMSKKDQYVLALERLCKEHGGPDAVAFVIHSSADNLKQILNSTPLPSGNPRGVGPGIRKKLSAAFPSWLEPPPGQIETKILTGHTPSATELALLFDMIPAADLLRRVAAYSAASKAIIDVLQQQPPTR